MGSGTTGGKGHDERWIVSSLSSILLEQFGHTVTCPLQYGFGAVFLPWLVDVLRSVSLLCPVDTLRPVSLPWLLDVLWFRSTSDGNLVSEWPDISAL